MTPRRLQHLLVCAFGLCRLNKEKPILPLPSSTPIHQVSKRNTSEKCLKAKEISSSDNSDSSNSDSGDFALEAFHRKLREKLKISGSVVSKIANKKLNSEQSVFDGDPKIDNPESDTTLTNKSVENKNNKILKTLDSNALSSLNLNESEILQENLTDNLKLDDAKQSLTCNLGSTINSVQDKLPSEPCCEITSEQSNADTVNKESNEPVSISKSKPGRKSLSSNILSKYGIKKGKKTIGVLE